MRKKACCRFLSAVLILGTVAGEAIAQPRQEDGFGSNPGNLRMFTHVPANLRPGAPLIVVLHGCKQKASTFARDAGWLALAESANVALLLPEQKGLPSFLYDVYLFQWVVTWLGANNQNACFNWFEPGDVRRDQGEALSIRQMIDAMVERYAVDRTRVYIAGLSAGAAMTAAMVAAYPERFAGAAIVAGVPVGCAENVSEALRCMSPGVDRSPSEWRRHVPGTGNAGGLPPVTIWHGDADTRVAPRNRQELIEQWTAAHGIAASPARREQLPALTREIYSDAAGSTRVESVLVRGLAHAFPIDIGGAACGQPGDYVVAAGVCATREIVRFWGLDGAQ